MSFDFVDYKKDFPLLMQQDVAYLDSAATAQRPASVLQAEKEFYEQANANPLRGLYELGVEATDRYEAARERVRKFLNARSDAEIIFTRNTTESINLVAYSYALNNIHAGDEIVITIMEHHSNMLPWQMVARQTGAIVFGILFFFPVHNPVAFIVINGICYLGASGMQVLIWAMVNDAIDYHELQTGERNEGIVYSTYSFFRKLASAISGSLSSFVLGAIGYNVTAGAVQTAGVVNAIWKSYTGIYFLGYGIAVAILFFVYPLTKQKTAEMLTELKARRAAKESK